MERFVGYPFVLTVNISDPEELAKAYEQALNLNVSTKNRKLKDQNPQSWRLNVRFLYPNWVSRIQADLYLLIRNM
jgi:hypothetical protein